MTTSRENLIMGKTHLTCRDGFYFHFSCKLQVLLDCYKFQLDNLPLRTLLSSHVYVARRGLGSAKPKEIVICKQIKPYCLCFDQESFWFSSSCVSNCHVSSKIFEEVLEKFSKGQQLWSWWKTDLKTISTLQAMQYCELISWLPVIFLDYLVC